MTRRLSLYTSRYCGPCRRVLASAKSNGIELELCDVFAEPRYREELIEARGRGTVPVLRIEEEGEVRWLPESWDIIEYLEELGERAA